MSFPGFIAGFIYIILNAGNLLFMRREKKIARILIKNEMSISTAESCTGGLISSRLTDVSGSSAFVFQNAVTYSNDSKINVLGVNKETIDKFGAVSRETAYEMAEGIITRTNASVSLAITGIAGPSGGTDTKPVGLVYIGVSNGKKTDVLKFQSPFLFPRRIMKTVFADKASDFLLNFLKNN